MVSGEDGGDPELEAPPIGTVLEGRYELVERLGEGGVGWVYRARHLKLGTEVAVKMLQAAYDQHESLRPRFEREAQALAALRHPHIVTLTDYSVVEGRPYLVMELLEGRTLAELLEYGAIEESRARRILRQALDAVMYAHGRGFAHRDLKPTNIFLVDLPTDPDHVKILDFGFVKLVDPPGARKVPALTRSGIAFGTPAYMCPEQATGGPTDPRADLYSLGIVFFEMLAGRRPWVGEIPDVIRAHLTEPVPPLSVGGASIEAKPELRAFLNRALAKLPDERFQSAAEMRDALDVLPMPAIGPQSESGEHAETMPPPAPEPRSRPSMVERTKRVADRAYLRWGALAAIALAIAIGVIWAKYDAVPTAPRSRSAASPLAARVRAPEPPPEEEPEAPPDPPALVREEPQPVAIAPVPIAISEPDASTAADAGTAPNDLWSARERVAVLEAARARLERGDALASAGERAVRDYVRDHRDDVRAHLVLARHYFFRGLDRAAYERYSIAHRVDERAKDEPHMLSDLLALSTRPETGHDASELVRAAYGRAAIPEVRRMLARDDLDARSRQRLRALIERLRRAR